MLLCEHAKYKEIWRALQKVETSCWVQISSDIVYTLVNYLSMAATQPPAMFEDEIIIEEVYIPPQYEELLNNSEGDGLKLVLF